jgi:hypothetical protein
MTPHEPTDDLTRLLRDAVDDIEPRPGLEAIRSRTSLSKEPSMNPFRAWILGGFGAAVATAAVIGGVVLVGNNDPGADKNPGPADTPSSQVSETPSQTTSETPSQTPSETPSQTPTDEPSDPGTSAPSSGGAVPVYYVGDTPSGPRLYREFRANPDAGEPVSYAVSTALGDALDRDYRSGWPAGTEATQFGLTSDLLTINLEGDLHDRPAGMTEDEAQIAIEQLIYTAQAAYGQGRVPVQFLLNGGHTDQLLGQPASEPLANGPVLQTNSHVQLSTPNEGDVISDGTLEVTGAANSFEANVVARLQRWEGNYIAFQEPITAEGWMGEKLFPFSRTFDVSNVAPGTYVLMVMTDDASGGAEGPGAFTDSRVITIE